MENIQYYLHLCVCGCGEQIEVKKHHKYKGIPKYLMNHWKPNLGKHHSIDHKFKLSEIGKKRKYTEDRNLKISKALKGHKTSEETKQKISKSEKGKIISEEHKCKLSKYKSENQWGINNPNWNNGSSFEPYPFEFNKQLKQQILERDNYTCQNPNCEHKTDLLDVHHIDYDKQNNSLENFVTLCDNCHMKTNGKNNRQYWTEFYQNIMENKINV